LFLPSSIFGTLFILSVIASSTLPYTLVRLVESETLKNDTLYATLSHCWGQCTIIRLLRGLYEEFTKGIKFDTLSKTFQDAVLLTTSLGMHYLWIDSLCIIQDAEENWARESSRMCSVYSNSWVTFAATSSTDGSGGLFHPREPLLTQPGRAENISTNAEDLSSPDISSHQRQ
jgi:hypothetical protein